MSRSKHGRPEEHFLGLIRQLKKENKRLKQQLRSAERNNVFKSSPRELEKVLVKMLDTCQSCGKGELSVLDLGPRRYQICSLCKERKRL